jgi:uncharacterized SAM-dependent methyltransferase
MPVELQIIRACEFIRMGAHGEFDFEKTRGLLADLARACRKRGIHRALIDIRKAHSNLTAKDLATLVNLFSEHALSKYLRLAIVHDRHQNYRTKLFVFFGAMRARKIRAFEDFEEALVWLSKPESESMGSQESEFEVQPKVSRDGRSRSKPNPSEN